MDEERGRGEEVVVGGRGEEVVVGSDRGLLARNVKL